MLNIHYSHNLVVILTLLKVFTKSSDRVHTAFILLYIAATRSILVFKFSATKFHTVQSTKNLQPLNPVFEFVMV